MAAFFVSASAQRLTNFAPPLVSGGYPLTVGLWAYPTTTGTLRSFFTFGASANNTNSLRLDQTAANAFDIAAQAGGSTAHAAAGTVTANQWYFLLARFIGAANRRISVLPFNGSAISSGQSTTSVTPTLNQIAFGSYFGSSNQQAFDGLIGEAWYTATDVQADNAVIQSSLMRQLAFGGPFSVPHIAKDIIEYHSLRRHPLRGDGSDLYVGGGKGVQAWTNAGGVTIGPHPPLPYWYASLRHTRRAMVPI